MIRWLLSQKSPLFVFMSPGAQRPCEIRTPPCCWQDRRGLLWLQALAAATRAGDAQLCASVSPSAKHGKAGGGEEVAGQGLKEGQREPHWVPAGCRHCSPPHRCLLGGHRRLPASALRAQDQAPDSFQPFMSKAAANPSPSHMGKSNSQPSAAPKGWRGDGAGKHGETLCHQAQAAARSQPRPQKCGC